MNRDPRSTEGRRFGLRVEQIFNEVLERGQADFTDSWRDPTRQDFELTPYERALLYGFFNLKGHLVELVEAMRQIFEGTAPHDPIVIDVGCGPGTGCLAVANALDEEQPFTYIGLDRAEAMLDLGRALTESPYASARMQNVRRHWVTGLKTLDWSRALGFRPILVVCSYLLASPTINPRGLVAELNAFIGTISAGPVYVLYTNTTQASDNRNFSIFQEALLATGYAQVCNALGEVAYDGKVRSFNYAGFLRARQHVLDLGD